MQKKGPFSGLAWNAHLPFFFFFFHNYFWIVFYKLQLDFLAWNDPVLFDVTPKKATGIALPADGDGFNFLEGAGEQARFQWFDWVFFFFFFFSDSA